MSKLVIVDYGMGNIRSVYNKFNKFNSNCLISNAEKDIIKADKIVIPGVGNFKVGINNLRRLNLIDILNELVIEKKIPVLGICLGAQLFANFSEEGNVYGLGWIDAEVVKFDIFNKHVYKIPHIGWNSVNILKRTAIKIEFPDNIQNYYYFVHSYHLTCKDKNDIWMTSVYEKEFISAVNKENIYGTQFHPEKSHESGIQLIKSFVEL